MRDPHRRNQKPADRVAAKKKLVEEGLERDIGLQSKEQIFKAALILRASAAN